jgi:hypothetical protein
MSLIRISSSYYTFFLAPVKVLLLRGDSLAVCIKLSNYKSYFYSYGLWTSLKMVGNLCLFSLMTDVSRSVWDTLDALWAIIILLIFHTMSYSAGSDSLEDGSCSFTDVSGLGFKLRFMFVFLCYTSDCSVWYSSSLSVYDFTVAESSFVI